MDINYKFVPEHESAEAKYKSDLISYAGRLLELADAYTLIVGLDEMNKPFVYRCSPRLYNALDVCFEP